MGEVSYAIALRSASEENEEQVLFVSREGLDRAPRLLVTYNVSPESGIAAIIWWWWIVAGGGVATVVGLAFFVGRRRTPAPESAKLSESPNQQEDPAVAEE